VFLISTGNFPGYHWDNSDWLPAKDDDSLADSRRDDREMYPAAARLMV